MTYSISILIDTVSILLVIYVLKDLDMSFFDI